MHPTAPSMAQSPPLVEGKLSFGFKLVESIKNSREHPFPILRQAVPVEAIIDYAKTLPDKWMTQREPQIKRVVLDNLKRLVKESGFNERLSADHGCTGTPDRISFKKLEEIILAWSADMCRTNYVAIFIDNPLRAETKRGRGVFTESLDMRFKRSRRQHVVGVEKQQVFSGALFEAEISGCSAAMIACAQH